MSLQTEFDQQWNRLQQIGNGQLSITLGHCQVSAQLPVVDRVGCQCSELSVASKRLAGATPDVLQTVADQLASKLTYLLEPLQVIEIDGQAQLVQMRSVPPTPSPGGHGYYEVIVQAGGHITLSRFTAPRGQTRHRTDATFTREVFEKLVHDLVAAIP